MSYKAISFSMFLICAFLMLSMETFESPQAIATIFILVMSIIAFHAYYILRHAGNAEQKPAEVESPNKDWYERY